MAMKDESIYFVISYVFYILENMVTSEIVRDDACNSCDVHYNLSKVAKILPHISTEYVLDFCLQLCEKLSTQEKHNICM